MTSNVKFQCKTLSQMALATCTWPWCSEVINCEESLSHSDFEISPLFFQKQGKHVCITLYVVGYLIIVVSNHVAFMHDSYFWLEIWLCFPQVVWFMSKVLTVTISEWYQQPKPQYPSRLIHQIWKDLFTKNSFLDILDTSMWGTSIKKSISYFWTCSFASKIDIMAIHEFVILFTCTNQ